MGGLLGVAISVIFIFVWFRPILKRQKESGGYVDKKQKITALVLGLIPASVALLACEILLAFVFKSIGVYKNEYLKAFLHAFIMYAFIEEAVKFLFSYLVIRRFERLKKIDIMIIFGFVGMGYEIAETFFNNNLFAGIMRGIFIAHIMYQFIMGHFFYESIHAKNNGDAVLSKKNMFFCFAVPMLIHGVNDFLVGLVSIFGVHLADIKDEQTLNLNAAIFFICFIMIAVINVFCLIWGLKLAKKDPEVEVVIK